MDRDENEKFQSRFVFQRSEILTAPHGARGDALCGKRRGQSKDITSVCPPPPAHQPPRYPPHQNSKVQPLFHRAVPAQLITQESANRVCRPRRAHISSSDPQPLTSRIRAHMHASFCTYAHNDRPYPRGGHGCARPNPSLD